MCPCWKCYIIFFFFILGYFKLFFWICWYCVWLPSSKWEGCSSNTQLVDLRLDRIAANSVTIIQRKIRHWTRLSDLPSSEKSQNTLSVGTMEINAAFWCVPFVWTNAFTCWFRKRSETILEDRVYLTQVSRGLLPSQHPAGYRAG